jgi:hypothetical protein
VHFGDSTAARVIDGTVRYMVEAAAVEAAAVKPTRVNRAAVEPSATSGVFIPSRAREQMLLGLTNWARLFSD